MKKDYRVTLSVRNNRLLSLIEEKFGSQSVLARKAGVNYSALSALVTMRDTPVGVNGWRPVAEKIASALGVFPADIWPDHMQDVRLKTRTADFSIDAEEVAAIGAAGPDRLEMRDLIEKGMDALNERERDLIAWISTEGAGASADEKAEFLGGVSHSRAWQIEQKAMRKMRQRLKNQHRIESLS